MRYDTPVYFVVDKGDTYNPETGDYDEGRDVKTLRMASVMDTSAKMLNLVYGQLREGSLTVQLQNHYEKPFDRIEVGGTAYKVDYQRKLRNKQTYIVSEVQ